MALRTWWDEELKNLTTSIPKRMTREWLESTGAGHFTQASPDLIKCLEG